MTNLIGIDADVDVSSVVDEAIAKGVRVFFRYLKNLTPREVDAIFAAAKKAETTVYIVSIFEWTAKRALGGAEAGEQDGATALTQASHLGQPQGSTIVATADFDEQLSQDAAVLAYMKAFKTAGEGQFKLTVYGNGALLDAAVHAGVADYTWLAGGLGMRGSRAMAAAGRETEKQDVGDKMGLNLGIDIDSDTVVVADDFGGWSAVATLDNAPVG